MHDTLVYIQPILADVLSAVFALVLALIVPQVPAIASSLARYVGLQGNAIARATIAQLLYDGIHLVETGASDAATHVGPIDVGDPRLAAVANYAIKHGPDELKHLGVDDAKIVAMAKVAIAQFPPKTSTTETTS